MKITEKQLTKVLVGVDFSSPSESALKEAVRLASQQNGEVYVLHIIEKQMLESLVEHSHLSKDEIVSTIKTRLECFCEAIVDSASNLKMEVKVGHSVKDFANTCDEYVPDLTVLGAWGSHMRDSTSSTGTTSKQIIQESKSDVLLMRPRESERFRSVVACIDFSSFDIPIIRAADQICISDGAKLEIFHVFYPPWKTSDITTDKEVDSDFEQEYEAVLRGRLDKLIPKNIHGVSNFESKTTVKESASHSEGILNHLRHTEADVVVIGARGASRIDSMILGRIAERIISESISSVYVVKNVHNHAS